MNTIEFEVGCCYKPPANIYPHHVKVVGRTAKTIKVQRYENMATHKIG